MSPNSDLLPTEPDSNPAREWCWDFVYHFENHRNAFLPTFDKVVAEYRKQKLDQFDVGPIGFSPEEDFQPIFPKSSFLGSWKTFETEAENKRQLLGGLFHQTKIELMEEALLLQERDGTPTWAIKAVLHIGNIAKARGRALSGADYDNFTRDLNLLEEGRDLSRESLHLEPRRHAPSLADQIKNDEAQSLRTWALSYQLNRFSLEEEEPAPQRQRAHLNNLWRWTAELQESNGIPMERFEETLYKRGGDMPEFQAGMAWARNDLSRRPHLRGEAEPFFMQFAAVRGSSFTLEIGENAPLMRLYSPFPKEETVQEI